MVVRSGSLMAELLKCHRMMRISIIPTALSLNDCRQAPGFGLASFCLTIGKSSLLLHSCIQRNGLVPWRCLDFHLIRVIKSLMAERGLTQMVGDTLVLGGGNWLPATSAHEVALRDTHVRKFVHTSCFDLTVEDRLLLLQVDVKRYCRDSIDVGPTRDSLQGS